MNGSWFNGEPGALPTDPEWDERTAREQDNWFAPDVWEMDDAYWQAIEDDADRLRKGE